MIATLTAWTICFTWPTSIRKLRRVAFRPPRCSPGPGPRLPVQGVGVPGQSPILPDEPAQPTNKGRPPGCVRSTIRSRSRNHGDRRPPRPECPAAGDGLGYLVAYRDRIYSEVGRTSWSARVLLDPLLVPMSQMCSEAVTPLMLHVHPERVKRSVRSSEVHAPVGNRHSRQRCGSGHKVAAGVKFLTGRGVQRV